MELTTTSLVLTLDALLAGSSRTMPSRLPKMLWPTQLRILKLRWANMGASTVFMSVSPVLPSLPLTVVLRSAARLSAAGEGAPKDGVEVAYRTPRSRGGHGER